MIAGGLTPSKTTYNQVLSAIRMLRQLSDGVYALDTGTAGVYQVAYTPAVTALVDGMVLKFKAKFANSGAATFAPNGVAAAPILSGNHAALQGGEITANGDVWAQWNSSIGGGAWILIDSTGGALQVAPATQSNHAVNLGQVQSRGIQASNITVVTTTGTLAATVAGGTVVGNSSSAQTQTLPAASTFQAGKRIEFLSINTGVLTISAAGSDTITVNNAAVASLALGSGDTLTLESNGTTGWYAVAGSAQLGSAAAFGSLVSANGYQRLPSGLIIQWGSGATNASGTSSIAFPIAFLTSAFSVSISEGINGVGFLAFGVGSLASASFSAWFSNASAGVSFYWLAVGK